jgi:hypothetical protein
MTRVPTISGSLRTRSRVCVLHASSPFAFYRGEDERAAAVVSASGGGKFSQYC